MLHSWAEVHALQVVTDARRGDREAGGGRGRHDVTVADVLDVIDPEVFRVGKCQFNQNKMCKNGLLLLTLTLKEGGHFSLLLTCHVHRVLAQESLARRPPHELPEAAEGGLPHARGALPVPGVLNQVAGGRAQLGVLFNVAAVGEKLFV